jgi:pyruvate carboxylase
MPQAMAVVRSAFEDDGIYIERYISRARRIEVQPRRRDQRDSPFPCGSIRRISSHAAPCDSTCGSTPENPDKGFIPSPGIVIRYRDGSGIDTHL